ncbi:transglycosylase SLT domain-containing protein [Methylobacterium nodulans]|uniref:Lytic transglycosylase catalytic n=1 Tax=Methylobacterium nodulans (strain LMG 21967 / CNCM I-2342 / ORS 2060) TaxID=460265 RepID=B8IFN0_METNO|nr:transglycosylase SLT domain-containing protein [Methylobacterium nodulans]ACL57765.1 Lytic transglycosylase catalytic [Methylobacterium nodulans ORS 2060]
MRQRLPLAVLAVAAPLPALALESPRDNIDALIEAHAKANGLPASFVHRVVKRESGYNPRAVGRGGALGLMQIKHGTARALGYSGPASGLLDAKVNLTYGVAYLAGAYKTARGNEAQAYSYYARGYYYAAKRAGIRTDVAELEPPPPAPANPLNQFFGKIFGGSATRAPVVTASADPSIAALSNAVQPQAAPMQAAPAEAQPATAAPASAAPTPTGPTLMAAPLPPPRPAVSPVLAYAAASPVAGLPVPTYGLRGGVAAMPEPPAAAPQATGQAPAAAAPAVATVASAEPAAVADPEAAPARITVPLPPRRPVEFRHFAVRKPAPPAPMTASAAPEATPAVTQ